MMTPSQAEVEGISLLIKALSERNPNGDWQRKPLVNRFRENTQALTKRQRQQVIEYLRGEVCKLDEYKYKQLSLLD